jgi:UDP-glucose 4-epimerase
MTRGADSKQNGKGRRAGELANEPKSMTRRARGTLSVAVTGAASFLGKNLIGLLEEDERVSRIVTLDIARPVTAGQKTRVSSVPSR